MNDVGMTKSPDVGMTKSPASPAGNYYAVGLDLIAAQNDEVDAYDYDEVIDRA